MTASQTLSAKQILKNFHVPESVIDKLMSHGVVIKVSLAQLNFVKEAEVLAKVKFDSKLAQAMAFPDTHFDVSAQKLAEVYLAIAKAFTEMGLDTPMELTSLVTEPPAPAVEAAPNVLAEALSGVADLLDKEVQAHEGKTGNVMFMSNSKVADSTLKKVVLGKKPTGWAYSEEAAASLHAGNAEGMVEDAPVESAGSAADGTDFSPVPLAKLKTLPKVKLSNATKLYQPVGGTSGGSRYFLMAANELVKIAARYDGGSLSVRAESADGKSHGSVVEGLLTNHGTYASAHFQCPDTELGMKTLGAIIMAAAGKAAFKTSIPDLGVIKDKGNG